MTPAVAMRRVVLPQAVVAMLPPLGNLWIELLKGSSLVSVITITDLAFVGRQIQQLTGRTTEVFELVLLIYFLLALPLTASVWALEKRVARGLQLGRG
jgi:polar amino acid transport system permease protein